MNFTKYLESRFVSSQLELQKKQTTGGHGENHAVLALMWVALKAITIYHLFLICLHYVAAHLGLVTMPKPAAQLASEEMARRSKDQTDAAEISKAAAQLAAPKGPREVK